MSGLRSMPSIQEGYRGVEVGVPLVRHGRTRDIRGCPMTGLWLCLKQASMGVPLHRSIEGLRRTAGWPSPFFKPLLCAKPAFMPSRLSGWLFGQGIRLESPCRPVGRCFIRSYRHRPWIVSRRHEHLERICLRLSNRILVKTNLNSAYTSAQQYTSPSPAVLFRLIHAGRVFY